MNTEKNKQENKKALKILVPVTIVAGVIGGVIGGVSATDRAQDLAGVFKKWLEEFFILIGPWSVIVVSIVGLIVSFCIYKSAVKEYEKNMPEGSNQELEEDLFKDVDHKISIGTLVNSVTMIVSFMLYAIVVAYLDVYIMSGAIILIAVSLLAFIITCLGQAKLQQMLVDFVKVMYPGKDGSVYDFRFSQKWEESCDELEKLLIYKAAYKAYKTTSGTCCIALVITILLSFFFHYGPLPAMVVGCIWLTSIVSYCLEAMKLDK